MQKRWEYIYASRTPELVLDADILPTTGKHMKTRRAEGLTNMPRVRGGGFI